MSTFVTLSRLYRRLVRGCDTTDSSSRKNFRHDVITEFCEKFEVQLFLQSIFCKSPFPDNLSYRWGCLIDRRPFEPYKKLVLAWPSPTSAPGATRQADATQQSTEDTRGCAFAPDKSKPTPHHSAAQHDTRWTCMMSYHTTREAGQAFRPALTNSNN